MKKTTLIISLLLSCLSASPQLYAHESAQAQHGGIVQSNHDINFELVDGGDCAQIYISDHGKPVTPTHFSGKLTILRGSNKTDFPLSVDGNTLKAKAAQLSKGDKVMLQLTGPQQKKYSVRFSVK